jgi:hypothetical protein
MSRRVSAAELDTLVTMMCEQRQRRIASKSIPARRSVFAAAARSGQTFSCGFIVDSAPWRCRHWGGGCLDAKVPKAPVATSSLMAATTS